ncbi:monovalent cation/H(+) antiporter subunit G [Rhizomonospora bruguierae]|uniref:monovalent cation/H(+) antiporter subunit G n=1 Tax=Rhizomonospora bruguierae TaxID=1581705 RepID=UPI00202B9833|nr:monovalent cation/H(+) antiporter subunit G [Micromonospora sp. NBRC 107566]
MSGRHLVAQVLVGAGTVVALAATAGAARPRDLLARLHFLTPVTSVGAPLIGVGLAVDAGWHLASALTLLTVLVLTVTGPVLAAATAHAARKQSPDGEGRPG